MIDLITGKIELDGVEIQPCSKIKDFEGYGKDQIDIFDRGNGRGIIHFRKPIECNGIYAQIKIEINENLDSRRVIITPSLNGLHEMKLIDASKLWLKGMANGAYSEDADSIHGSYEWGYISAQYREDRDYGVVGGEIVISYGEQELFEKD